MHALLIVPHAHVRFDPLFQTEMYELFHRRALARLGHLVCTPLINIALLAALPLALPHRAVVRAAAIALWSLYVDRAAGTIMIPIALAAGFVANAIAPQLGSHGLLLALGAAWAGALLQALSHATEPIPPPWTGSHAFMPLGTWLRAAPASRIALLFLLSPTVFPLLEAWAAPRVWVLQVLHAMMRLGYRAELRAQLDGRVVAMLDDARAGWPQPAL
jgi:hypothetical protein